MSVAYHVQLPLSGKVIVTAATGLLNQEIRGHVSIGELQNIRFDKLVARSVVVTDPQGREVIRVSRLAVWPDWGALLSGRIRIDRARARGGEVVLYVSEEDPDTVSLVEAFTPVDTTPSVGPPPTVIVDNIILDEILLRGDAPSYPGLRIENMRVTGAVESRDSLVFRVFDGRGTMTGPYPGRISLDRIVGRFDTDMTRGLDAFARAHRGEDRVRASITLTRPVEEAPPVMNLLVRLDPLRLSTVTELGLAEGVEDLQGTVRGYARLQGSTEDLRLRADLTSGAGRVHVRGALPTEGPLVLEAWTEDRLALHALIPAAPEMRVGGRVRLVIEEDESGAGEPVRRLHATVEPLHVADVAIPAFELDGVLGETSMVITELTSDHVGDISAEGEVGYDGSVDVHVHASIPDIAREPNVARLAPDARGALTASLDVRADEGLENLRFDGRVSMRGARYGSMRADSLEARGHVSGLGPSPVLRVDGTAEGLRIDELSLGAARVSIHGGPGGYEVVAESTDERAGTRVALRGRARSTGGALTLDAPSLLVDLGPGAPLRGRVRLAFRPGESLTLSPLELAREDERLVVSGIYRFEGDDEIDATFTDVELEPFAVLSPEALRGLRGRVTGELELRGDVDRRPEGTLTARVTDGAFRGVTDIDGGVALTLRGDTLDTDVQLDLGRHGSLEIEGPIVASPAALRNPERLIEEASLDGLRVSAQGLDLALVRVLGILDDFPVTGRVSTDVVLSGNALQPGLRDAVLVLDGIALEGWDPLRAKVSLSYGDGRVHLRRLWVADAAGALGSAEGELPFSMTDPPRSLRDFWRQINAASWSVSARLDERRLDTWPRPIRDLLPLGMSFSASVTAEGDENGPRADLAGIARFVASPTDDECAANLRPVAMLRGTLEGDVAEARVTGFFGGSTAEVEVDLAAYLPLDQWVREGGVAVFPDTEVSARVRGAEMSQVPWLCGYGSGPINGTLTAKDVLAGDSVLGLVLDLPRVRIWDAGGERDDASLSAPYRIHVRAGSSPDRGALTACTILGVAGTHRTPGAQCRSTAHPLAGEMIARLRVPVVWTAGEFLPTYDEGALISSWSEMNEVHMEPVLAFIPGIVGGDAVMNGNVEVTGALSALRMRGGLDLSQGHLRIEGLGQHLADIRGRVELTGTEAIFPEDAPLHASDSGGTATVSGRVGFEGVVPRSLDLSLAARSFPIRQEGMVLAWLTGAAAVTGRIDDDQTRSTIRTRGIGRSALNNRFVVRLPEQTAATLQPLEDYPDILIVGERRPRSEAALGEIYPIHVEIDARHAFRVQRNDFTALVNAHLYATYRDPELRVDGDARILRGTFEIFGKRFELTGGSLAFDGSTELDPRVNVTALYEIPGRTGATVTVAVSGRLSDPVVSFSSTESGDQAEIIALLIGGGRRATGTAQQEASQQAASFLAGLTAGILTLGLRQEFGDVIPVLAIESEGAGGTRIRAGIDANDLIPDFLSGIVTGAYLEGFFTAAAEGGNAAGASSGGGGVGGGVTLELTFPENFLFRGTYVPVDNGGLDILYEP